ncbi:MAG: hypothetical protein ACT4O5_07125 [Gammaproteobacteria bacterium]
MHEADHRSKGERDAYKLLYAGFMAAPIIAGIDKFTDKLGNWDRYLSDGVADTLPVERHTFMQGVGLIEIAAGLLVAAKPKWGGYVVSAWLLGIIANLWTKPEYRDIALRDFGLALGALALARMAADSPREQRHAAALPA